MANRFDEKYIFRLAHIEDVDMIMQFIRDEWGRDHILGHNRDLFLWQYGSSEYDDHETINVILMLDRLTLEMCGMIGFIPYSDEKEAA